MLEAHKIGRYEIIEEKGHGAMGAVYVARDPAMDRIVAVKTIHSLALTGPHAQEFRERFYREARSAGGLAHPGIVTVFDVGEQDDVPYLVMEFIEGRTLTDAAKTGERFTLERVYEIGQQIAEALGYAHKHGVIHRDIKPANILLTSKEKYGVERPKITDFGVAKLGAAELTTTGQMLGTPAFMPPEQFTGAPIDGRSDIFSLGVILYWMATGELAFPGETITAVSYKVVHTEPVAPRNLNPAVPAGFDRIILKCLAKAPSERYASGEELARDLAAHRAGRTEAELHAPMSTVLEGDSGGSTEVTLDSHPTATGDSRGVRRSGGAALAPGPSGKPKHQVGAMVGILAAVVILAAGWYGYRHRQNIASILDTSSSHETPADPSPSDSGATTTRPVTREHKEDLSGQPARSTAKSVSPVAKNPALPAPPHVTFDPRQLDPNANAKLKIEAEQFPENVDFTVEMNGRVYFDRGAAKNQTVFEDLYVPPGVMEFRVIAGAGADRKTSNIVSEEFKPKKKKTLRIELRTQGQKSGSGIPAGVYPDSQIIVSLK